MVGEGGEYRPVSWLAVAAVIGGFVSALGLLGPLFWVVPLLGTLLALVALADVGRDGVKVGRWAALAGLFLAVGFGAQAVASHVVNRRVAAERAVATARHWVATVQKGNITDAAKMISPGAIDRGPMVPGAAEETLEALLGKHPLVNAIRDCGPAATPTVTLEGTLPADSRLWVATVSVAPCGNSPGGVVIVRLILQSTSITRKGRGYDSWQIFKLADSRAPIPSME